MIKIEDAEKLILDKPESEAFLKKDLIDGILEKDKNNPRNRLPILNTQMIAKYMIHRSIIDKFIVKKAVQGEKIEDLTLQDMLNEPKYKKMITESFGTIKESSSLLKAKEYIDSITICLDVFVTTTGEPGSPVIGWITNVIITEESII